LIEVKPEADSNDITEHPLDENQGRICVKCVTNGIERKNI